MASRSTSLTVFAVALFVLLGISGLQLIQTLRGQKADTRAAESTERALAAIESEIKTYIDQVISREREREGAPISEERVAEQVLDRLQGLIASGELIAEPARADTASEPEGLTQAEEAPTPAQETVALAAPEAEAVTALAPASPAAQEAPAPEAVTTTDAPSGEATPRGDSMPGVPGTEFAAVETVATLTDEKPDGEVKIDQIHFLYDSTKLTPGAQRKIMAAAERIREAAPREVRIIGFADTVGPEDYNQTLSVRRAQSVADLLMQAGVPVREVQVSGLGESVLPEPTQDNVEEPLNRCVSIRMVH